MSEKGKSPVHIDGAVITPQISELISEFQESDNDYIEMYNDFFDRITEMLFGLGNELPVGDPKDELFYFLNMTHQLRRDINKLRKPNKPLATQASTHRQ